MVHVDHAEHLSMIFKTAGVVAALTTPVAGESS